MALDMPVAVIELTGTLLDGGPGLDASKALAALSLLDVCKEDQDASTASARLTEQCTRALANSVDPQDLARDYDTARTTAKLDQPVPLQLPQTGQLTAEMRKHGSFHTAASCADALAEIAAKMSATLLQATAARQREKERQAQAAASAAAAQAARPSAATTGRWTAPAAAGGSSTGATTARGGARMVAAKRTADDTAPTNTTRSQWAPPAQQQQQPAQQGDGEGPAASEPTYPSGFQSARQQYNKELIKEGKGHLVNNAPPRNTFGLQPIRRGGLQGRGGRGGAAPSTGGGGGDPNNPDTEGQWSEKALQKLAGPDGKMPPIIEKCDTRCVEQILNGILDSGARVSMEDVAGLKTAKQLLQEIIVWPMCNPELFKGARQPPKGALLFGPPGTGKTLIGKAVACSLNATFFAISAASLTSKWIGEGEKMVVALFAVAECLQPSVIFIDEIDSLLSARKSEGEHEASRRLKNQFLTQMEGLDTNSDRRLLVIGATNRPEELDEAARRRMPKQLYIPLPCSEARRQMILRAVGPGTDIMASLSESDLSAVVDKTAGYSGSDMRNLIQEACQNPIRELNKQHMGSGLPTGLTARDLRPVTLKDFKKAHKNQKPSVTPDEIQRYEEYNRVHGAQHVESDDDSSDEEW